MSEPASIGSRAAHVRCWCQRCADRYGDQADTDDREPGSILLSDKERKLVLYLLGNPDMFDRQDLKTLIRRLS